MSHRKVGQYKCEYCEYPTECNCFCDTCTKYKMGIMSTIGRGIGQRDMKEKAALAEALFVFLMEDDGKEVVPTVIDKNHNRLTLIYTDFVQAEKFCPVAIQLAKQMRKRIKLVKFSTRDELGVFDCR